ncbi:hypothetical protein [Frondihabitans australicus]|uniref:Transcriptional regulator, AbiEi antitoxin, Type IV TA system n=1 Tax=Frondihabitans australicus TaxID=386892 RepID=A0A495IFA5_9MICO|nr:hypothetical protein [Frondihabitans australicus]RKR73865.1 hypothetical protein C8E83_0962 [Frondihabitans australicus]
MCEPALEPHPSLLVRASLDDTAVRRACLRGDLVRLTAGRYVRREHWDPLDEPARHVMQCLAAVSRLDKRVVVSHASAAAFWGLPRLGPWPGRAHVIDPTSSRATTRACATIHAAPLDDTEIVERHGSLVTSAARTAVDIAVTAPFRQAVTCLDDGLRTGLFTDDDLRTSLDRRPTGHGRRRAAAAILFADRRANRSGESLSRVVMHESGIATPELQHHFDGPDGLTADVDFFWPEQGIVGEFDGETKYRDSERWSGLSPEEVVIREKYREDWIRALPQVQGFVRWTWRDAYARGSLARLLADSGVPIDLRGGGRRRV